MNHATPYAAATPREVLSISAVTRHIKLLLETELPALWVTGEISNFKHHSSGHYYFSLKDEGAQMPCVMWAGRNRALSFLPQDGMQVIAQGQITVYEKRGYYQLEVWHMQPAGLGALQFAFEQLKQRLQQEGLFDASHKVPLPAYPQRVGLVTSPTGAALHDLISVIRRRWPGMRLILRPVRVQGVGAAEEIAQALDEFNAFGAVDLVIVARGGGSLEDLWPFNEEIVARAIQRSALPVVSAVGHEVDFSISDFVADVRAATPSAAAELVAPEAAQVARGLQALLQRGGLHLRRRLQLQRERLERLYGSYGLRQPLDQIRQRSQELDELHRRLILSVQQLLQRKQRELAHAHDRLRALSHESTLQRGFALVFREADGVLVRSAGQLAPADMIRLRLAHGASRAQVESTETENGIS